MLLNTIYSYYSTLANTYYQLRKIFMTSLGIIGTALRGKDTEFDTLCTKDTYSKMLNIARTKVKELSGRVYLISNFIKKILM